MGDDQLCLGAYDQPNVMFLNGCFLQDCNTIEDMFDERLVTQSSNDNIYNIDKIVYDKIPKMFETNDKWLEKTNIKCWSCSCLFYTIPITSPSALHKENSNIKMDIDGIFCTWGCASQYINVHSKGVEKWERHELLKKLYTIITGKIIDSIEPSPPKTIMIQYGGKKSQKEYMDIIHALNPGEKITTRLSLDYNITI